MSEISGKLAKNKINLPCWCRKIKAKHFRRVLISRYLTNQIGQVGTRCKNITVNCNAIHLYLPNTPEQAKRMTNRNFFGLQAFMKCSGKLLRKSDRSCRTQDTTDSMWKALKTGPESCPGKKEIARLVSEIRICHQPIWPETSTESHPSSKYRWYSL